ncbi:MAG: type II toxin-antitoxin system VapC family toxin [Paludibacter sp.]|jgi:predicted nucleic acid-binding protein|nr:type II toxin-antitoxin system VapC family toxin [Paludibacter sp.]
MYKHHIFIDTNILIYAFSGQKPKAMECLDYLLKLQGRKLFTSAFCVGTMISTLQKTKGSRQKLSKERIIKIIKNELLKINILPFSETDIQNSFPSIGNDMEDNIQYQIGAKAKCYYFITDDKKGFKFFKNIQVLNLNNYLAIKQKI